VTTACRFDENDVWRIVQDMAQPLRGAHHAPCDAGLFVHIATLDDFSSEQVKTLASSALRFFDLDSEPHSLSGLSDELCRCSRLEDWATILHTHWTCEAVCFHTSGSTGIPVRHRQLLVVMEEEMAAVAPVFASRTRIVSVMPMHHIYGFMLSMLLAKWKRVPIMYMPPLPLASFFAELRDGDVIIGFPLFWQSLLSTIRREGKTLFLPPDIRGLTATAPPPPGLIQNLLDPAQTGESPPLTGLSELYGSTETMGIAMRHNGEEWYELLSTWDTASLADGSRGISRIRGDGSQWGTVPLPDIVTWHPQESRRFRPERRTDMAVQVGGVNVYPDRVAEIIRSHPMVRDCAVRLMRPEEGTRLKIFIVPKLSLEEAAPHFGKSFRIWMAERLETANRPKHIRLGNALPVNEMGKARDWD
jgi:4-coumarate--CoA ligase (photoactive yellow protein activation family)